MKDVLAILMPDDDFPRCYHSHIGDVAFTTHHTVTRQNYDCVGRGFASGVSPRRSCNCGSVGLFQAAFGSGLYAPLVKRFSTFLVSCKLRDGVKGRCHPQLRRLASLRGTMCETFPVYSFVSARARANHEWRVFRHHFPGKDPPP